METCLQPREVVLDFGLLPLQVLCPQLETVAGVQVAHRTLAAMATPSDRGNKYVSCSAIATVLDLSEQQCRLLLDTLAAVGGGSSSSVPAQGALEPLVNLHELSLFLLAQIYGRESHRPETQDHWPDPSSSSTGPQVAAGSRPGAAASPSGGTAANNSRLLIKAQLAALQRQHAAYSRGYAEFLERHARVMLELILDDASGVEAWQQQRAAQVQQHKASQLQAQQEAAREPGGGDSDMTPADDAVEPASTAAAPAAAPTAMDVVQQEGPAAAGAGQQLEQQQQGAAPSSSGRGAAQQQPSGRGNTERSGSMLSSSSGSLVSLGGSSFPPVNITAPEFDRLGLLLEAARISKAELAVLLEQSSSSSSGAAAGSGRSLFADLNLSAAVNASGGSKRSGEQGSGSGSNGDWLASRITSSKLSSFVPGFFAAGSVSMEECFNWLSSCWLHKMQQAVLQQHKHSAAAAGGGSTAAAGGANAPPGVSPLFQQPVFGAGSAGDAAAAAAGGGGGGSAAKQPTSGRGGGVASMLGDLAAGGGSSSNVAAWLGMSSSPPKAAAQQLRVLGSPAGLNATSSTAGGSLGTFVGGLNGVPVVNSVSSTGPGPTTPTTQAAAGAGAAASPAAAAGSSPAAAAAAAAPVPAAGDGLAGGSPAAAVAAAAGGGSGGGGAGLAGLLGGGPTGLGSIKVSTTRGMVAVAGGSVDEASVCGVYRGTVVRGPSDVGAGECLTVQDCNEAQVYVLAPVKLARIVNCSDCNICIGAVSTLLRIERCERLQLTAAAGQVVVLSCHSCCLHLGTHRQPAILGDCRFVKLAPHNLRYETLPQHLASAGISVGKQSLWDIPLIMAAGSSSSSSSSERGPGGHGGSSSGGGAAGTDRGANSSCGGGSSRGGSSCGGGSSSMPGVEQSGASSGGGAGSGGGSGSGGGGVLQQRARPGATSPSSPHTHGGSGSSERRGGAATPKPVLLLPPEEFFPFVVPFRGTPGPLAGGVAHHASTHWQPNSHKSAQGPLAAFPFPLPPEYDAALQQQYGVVTELRSKIKGSGLDEGRRTALQNVIQSYFREWLHTTGNIRQVYDLSKLEGDEYGLSGSSPTAFNRDPHSL